MLTAGEPLLFRGRHDLAIDDQSRCWVVEDRIHPEDSHLRQIPSA